MTVLKKCWVQVDFILSNAYPNLLIQVSVLPEIQRNVTMVLSFSPENTKKPS